MRATTSLSTLLFTAIVWQSAKAQTSVSAFGLIPKNDTHIDCASGFGFNFFTKSLLPAPKIDTNIYRWKVKPPEFRLGVQFYSATLRKRMFEDIGGTGNMPSMIVSNRNWGADIAARISGAYSQKIIPYLDLMLGSRSFIGSTQTTYYTNYKESKTTQTSVGAVAGAMMKLKGCMYADFGVMLTHSRQHTKMYNVNSGRYESDAFIVDQVDVPNNIIMVKVGFTVVFNGEGFIKIPQKPTRSYSQYNYTPYYNSSNSYYDNNSGNSSNSSSGSDSNSNSYYDSGSSGDSNSSGNSNSGSGSSSSSNSSSSSSSSSSGSSSSGSSSGSNSTHSSNNNSYSPTFTETKAAPGSNSTSPAPQGNKTASPGKGGK